MLNGRNYKASIRCAKKYAGNKENKMKLKKLLVFGMATVIAFSGAKSFSASAAGDEVFVRSGGKSGDYVYVAISPETHSRTVMEGFWSPDSIKFTRTK